jgi:hypothetical protein
VITIYVYVDNLAVIQIRRISVEEKQKTDLLFLLSLAVRTSTFQEVAEEKAERKGFASSLLDSKFCRCFAVTLLTHGCPPTTKMVEGK